MEVIKLGQSHQLPSLQGPLGLIIGNFDGVHYGHQQILSTIAKQLKSSRLRFAVMTFIPHPRKILSPESAPFLLNTYSERRELLEKQGVEILFEVDFNRDFSTLTPEVFLKKYVFGPGVGIGKIFIGHDFHFGANQKGHFDSVQKFCKKIDPAQNHGLVPQQELMRVAELGKKSVSSSVIRDCLLAGDVEQAIEFLTRPFFMTGVVIKGQSRGKQIGFPTANIQFSPDRIIPEKGVYAGQCLYKGMTYNSITNIGTNPTFQSTGEIHVETHIFDFQQEIYGEEIRIYFHKKIRSEQKFSSVNSLIEQISQDVITAKNYLRDKQL